VFLWHPKDSVWEDFSETLGKIRKKNTTPSLRLLLDKQGSTGHCPPQFPPVLSKAPDAPWDVRCHLASPFGGVGTGGILGGILEIKREK